MGDGLRQRELDFEVLFATSSAKSKAAEDVLEDLMDGKGWVSKRDSSYPQQMILGWESICNIVKIQVLCHALYIPKKIDFLIATDDGREADPRKLKFDHVAFTEFHSTGSRSRDPTVEERTVFVDTIGNVLLLKIHGNIRSSRNERNQVGIRRVKVIGYEKENPKKDACPTCTPHPVDPSPGGCSDCAPKTTPDCTCCAQPTCAPCAAHHHH